MREHDGACQRHLARWALTIQLSRHTQTTNDAVLVIQFVLVCCNYVYTSLQPFQTP